MDKMRVRNLNLVPSYVLIAIIFLLGAMFVADFEREYIESVQIETAQKYTKQVETFNEYRVWDKQGNVYEFTKADSNKIRRLDFFYYIFPHMAYISSTFLASLVYYRIKLKKPLRFLADEQSGLQKMIWILGSSMKKMMKWADYVLPLRK